MLQLDRSAPQLDQTNGYERCKPGRKGEGVPGLRLCQQHWVPVAGVWPEALPHVQPPLHEPAAPMLGALPAGSGQPAPPFCVGPPLHPRNPPCLHTQLMSDMKNTTTAAGCNKGTAGAGMQGMPVLRPRPFARRRKGGEAAAHSAVGLVCCGVWGPGWGTSPRDASSASSSELASL